MPNVNIPLASDDTDTALIRSQCKSVVCDASWRMVFATSDEEFEKMWDDMCVQLEGFGWNDLVAFDTNKYQAVIDARKQQNKSRIGMTEKWGLAVAGPFFSFYGHSNGSCLSERLR